MKSYEISSYAGAYNMLGLAVEPASGDFFLIKQGPGDNLWRFAPNGALIYSKLMDKGGVAYGSPQSLGIGRNSNLLVSRPVYSNDDVVDSNMVEMNQDGSNMLSVFTDYCYTYGGAGISYNTTNGHLLVSSYTDKIIYEVTPGGILIDYFDSRAGAADIAFDPYTGNIFVMYQHELEGVIDEYRKEGFRTYRLVKSYSLASVGITSTPMAFDINTGNGHFFVQENNMRVVEFDRTELGPAIPDVTGCLNFQGSHLVNAKVILEQDGEPKQTVRTDSGGTFQFENVVSGKKFQVRIKGPIVP